MGQLWSVLVIPFAYIMKFCYGLFENYGIALILYALITKIVLLPFSIKQQKNQIAMLKLKPYQDELMKKYGGNKQKYQEELMKLYQDQGYSPMSSCLPTFIQLPVIFLIYAVVRRPLTYIAGVPLNELAGRIAQGVGVAVENIQNFTNWPALAEKLNLTGKAAETIGQQFHRYELRALSGLESISDINVNIDFLGLDLGMIPKNFLQDGWFQGAFWIILIPILAGVTSYLATWVSQKLNPSMNDAANQGSMKMMNVMMPLVSVFFSFTMEGVLGFYWIASNLVAIAQTFLLNKIMSPKKALEEVEANIKAKKEAEKEKRRLAAEKKAALGSKNSKKKRAMTAQNVKKEESSDGIDTDNSQEN